jgi:hypothetical protein
MASLPVFEKRTHVVKKGETLHGICKRLTGSASPWDLTEWRDRIIRANHLDDTVPLKPGMELIIPDTFPVAPMIDSVSNEGQQRLGTMAMTQRDDAYAQLDIARSERCEAIKDKIFAERVMRIVTIVGLIGWLFAAIYAVDYYTK